MVRRSPSHWAMRSTWTQKRRACRRQSRQLRKSATALLSGSPTRTSPSAPSPRRSRKPARITKPSRPRPNGCAPRWSGWGRHGRSMADAARPAPRGRGDLTQGPIAKTLLAFALPTLASSILQSLNGTINAIWVGRFLGEGALAATSNANMVMFLLSSFVFGFGMASTSLIGQAWGRKDVDEARRVFGTASGSFALITILVAVAGWFLAPAILQLLGTPGDAAPLALAYLRVIFLALPALL